MRIRVKDLLGRTVIDATGRAIGSLHDFYLDEKGLEVHSLRIKLRPDVADQMGLRHTAFHPALLDVPRSSVQALGETVVLKLSGAALHPEAHPPAP